MKVQVPQGGSIIGISSISALVGGELQWLSSFDISVQTWMTHTSLNQT